MTREELLAALLVERYGHTRPQWHGDYGVPAETQELMRLRAEMEDESEVNEEEAEVR